MIIAVAITACVCLGGGYFLFSGENATGQTTITLDGSSTLAPTMEKLAEAYEENTGMRIEVTTTDSAMGAAAVRDKLVDIGMSSNSFGHAAHDGLVETQIGTDIVVLIVHPSVTAMGITSLTKSQVAGIYGGTITDWSQINDPNSTTTDNPIAYFDREAGSGTRSFFEKTFGVTSEREEMSVKGGTGLMRQAVEETSKSIGYISFGSVSKTATAYDILDLDLDGNGPESPGNNDNYKATRPLIVLTVGQPAGEVYKFINWILSPEGQAIVASMGMEPLYELP